MVTWLVTVPGSRDWGLLSHTHTNYGKSHSSSGSPDVYKSLSSGSQTNRKWFSKRIERVLSSGCKRIERVTQQWFSKRIEESLQQWFSKRIERVPPAVVLKKYEKSHSSSGSQRCRKVSSSGSPSNMKKVLSRGSPKCIEESLQQWSKRIEKSHSAGGSPNV
ncbi:hypothetical protein Btru_068123 [Bulinus truncatus]|nr:hypothetical protein Btru_068123 [Bulinus truncatus]